MDKTVSDPNFAGMAVFTPVINGEALASAAGGTKGELASLSLRAPASQTENLAQREDLI